jgi:lysophospholipase L1-like esterase
LCLIKKLFIRAGLSVLLCLAVGSPGRADCEGDIDRDGYVDEGDLTILADELGRTDCETASPCKGDIHPIGSADGDVDGSDLVLLIKDFGRADCPIPPPVNLFNIGNSIGEGEAADNIISSLNHDAVWSTGFEPADIVYSLSERFEDIDPAGFYENNAARDPTLNRAISGSVMDDFVIQADEVVAAAGATPSGTAGMVTILLGNNDVCAPTLNDMTDPAQFELQYRAGLDVLAAAAETRNAYIHVSGIPAIYWLWNAKRTDLLCRFIIWPFVPCENLLDNPANDCGSGNSHLDPDNIHPDDGDNCIRRKQFHARIRDIYNPILRDVLLEYKLDGRLPNAYYVDILDIQFDGNHVNDGDCFHPSYEGHELLAEEQWCRSPWGMNDEFCNP